ncbi:unnamed protein product [Prunus armeniaca]|uniref:Uncharacterized protein n=1 Tax=Prunus armeniaca TaxID=36596 RepID=A0A6J5WDG8_PRUAR|nr:unnamed protein product [Prunus armeniaca]
MASTSPPLTPFSFLFALGGADRDHLSVNYRFYFEEVGFSANRRSELYVYVKICDYDGGLCVLMETQREKMKGRNKHVEGLLSIVHELSDKLIS